MSTAVAGMSIAIRVTAGVTGITMAATGTGVIGIGTGTGVGEPAPVGLTQVARS
jgi:hypothetical protein